MYARATLSNGVRILTSTVPSVRSVSIGFFFGVGSRYETTLQSGVSHFIEHMLFKGSARFPTARVISESIEGVGGILDAATDKELTVYSAKIASTQFELAFGVLADMVRHPLLDPAELEKERRVIIEELNMYRDSPQEWVGVIGDETVWPNDLSLGREVAGTRETVSGITRDEMEAYRTSHYVPGNLVLGVVGNVDHDRIVAAAERLLGDWEHRPVPLWTPCPRPLDVPRVRVEYRETEQTNLCLYAGGLSHKDPDNYALSLLNAILGDGMASRLFLEVREQQGLAYDISSSPINYHDTGAFVIGAGVEPSRTVAALQAVFGELRRLRDEPVADDELTRAREYTKGRLALRLEDTSSIASWLGAQEVILGEVHELDEIMARYDAVNASDVQRLARTLFTSDQLRLAIIGPQKDPAQLDQIMHVES
ncbi:MAG TPA: pitrilysin family protein [Ktedonobacterales bacterium]|nr:pitrilysin family protein [Ktedonobacterales bacterium]